MKKNSVDFIEVLSVYSNILSSQMYVFCDRVSPRIIRRKLLEAIASVQLQVYICGHGKQKMFKLSTSRVMKFKVEGVQWNDDKAVFKIS